MNVEERPSEVVCEIRDLHIRYRVAGRDIDAVNGVSLHIRAGERFGIVGESGSGKSTLVHGLLRLVKEPGRIVEGEVVLDGVDLMKLSEEDMRLCRLARIALVPQGAMNSLNPVMRVEDQFALAMRDHGQALSGASLKERVAELLGMVQLEESVARCFPHELSGGMKQRVVIAMAISLSPRLVCADEPTSALDVLVQRRLMETLGAVQERTGVSILLVGHDVGLMAQFVDRIGVMYGGRLVETGGVEAVFEAPLHPYTRLLLEAVPTFERRSVLKGIPGPPVSLEDPPRGCLFHPRCPESGERCRQEAPPSLETDADRRVACFMRGRDNGSVRTTRHGRDNGSVRTTRHGR